MATHSVDSPSGRHWTVDEYMELDDEQEREVLRGELVVTPAPNFAHQRSIAEIGSQIRNWVREHDLGEYAYAPVDVVLADDTVVQPDFVYVADERFDELYDGHGLTGAPDLVIEVLSPATVSRDRTTKREIYAEAGVRWLVHVDPEARTVEVFELGDDGRYSLAESACDEENFEIGLFPGLTVELEGVWLEEEK
jgi:Uma2 family endonuclease